MGNWIKRTSMPTPRHDLQSIAVDGKIYAISGADDLTLDVVEIYDVERDTWSAGLDRRRPAGCQDLRGLRQDHPHSRGKKAQRQ